MADTAIFREKFNSLKACVIIPTYNNAFTLAGVVADVAAYTDNIIVVNDGSTDNTGSVLASLHGLTKVSYSKNKGKGWALRQGFKTALELGYQYAITIDSDGQHFAKDLPIFIEKLETSGPAIIMGARNLNEENMPGKNSFGNKFSILECPPFLINRELFMFSFIYIRFITCQCSNNSSSNHDAL